ncbi:MAG: retroviral-like aspartic protease family protein, partial [Pseudomonas fluorescens]|nr:retroviral-like aspartic protease family protein [Pseudomonas fluorescens]
MAGVYQPSRRTVSGLAFNARRVPNTPAPPISTAPSNGSSVVLKVGDRGHFTAPAMINGVSINMLVDTGASLIALPAADAIRLGINYRQG